ncbi:MAG: pre-peptidase C-terminal domain-containing protein [Dehalococcoidia bacterium]
MPRFSLPSIGLALALVAGAALLSVMRSEAGTPAPEPNDTPETCSPIAVGNTVNAVIGAPGDVDYYCFTGNAGQTIAADIDSAQAGEPPFDSLLTLYPATGGALAHNDDHDGFDSYLEYTFASTGTYRLRVKSNYSCCGGPEYAYTLKLTQLAAPATPTPLPVDDPSCVQIAPGAVINDAIDPEGDRDSYCFSGTGGQVVIGDIDATQIGSILDGVLYLHDEHGNQLARSDDHDDFDPYIQYTLPATQRYVFRIQAAEDPYFGGPQATYTFRFTAPSAPPTPTASPGAAGDASCDGHINSIDAALVLQNSAGLLQNIPCANQADVNDDGVKNSLDAALILQYSAGLLNHLPV